jgi:hypothetical protein
MDPIHPADCISQPDGMLQHAKLSCCTQVIRYGAAGCRENPVDMTPSTASNAGTPSPRRNHGTSGLGAERPGQFIDVLAQPANTAGRYSQDSIRSARSQLLSIQLKSLYFGQTVFVWPDR